MAGEINASAKMQDVEPELIDHQLVERDEVVAVVQPSQWGLLLIDLKDGSTVAILEDREDAALAWKARYIMRFSRQQQIEIDKKLYVDAGGQIHIIPFGMTGEKWNAQRDVAGLEDLLKARGAIK